LTYKVPFVDAKEHYRRYRHEFEPAILTTLANGDLIMRQQLRSFEERLAAFCGVKYAVGVNSGYHALHLSMLAAGLGPGDEVITVAHTFVATISAIVHCGATPVLVDVRDDYNMDADAAARAVTPRTKAIVPVHLNGRIADMGAVMEIARKHKLVVIEDAAQALGATFDGRRAGSFGLTGCFSFYPFKILGCFGDGGAVTTDDPDVATAIRRLRYNGEDRETGEYHFHGYTALLDNVQAAILGVKMTHFPEWVEHRRKIADAYRDALAGVGDLRLPHFDHRGTGAHGLDKAEYHDVFQNYVIRTAHRDALRDRLRADGVETLLHWPKPVWEHKALKIGKPRCPNTEAICREVLSLPMSAETTMEQVAIVAESVRGFFQSERSRRRA